jgi:hypothetical protein
MVSWLKRFVNCDGEMLNSGNSSGRDKGQWMMYNWSVHFLGGTPGVFGVTYCAEQATGEGS